MGSGSVRDANHWKVGLANIFVDALRLRPFFGAFKSYRNESGSNFDVFFSPQHLSLSLPFLNCKIKPGWPSWSSSHHQLSSHQPLPSSTTIHKSISSSYISPLPPHPLSIIHQPSSIIHQQHNCCRHRHHHYHHDCRRPVCLCVPVPLWVSLLGRITIE